MSDAVDFRVLELLCSKMCHDLVSPVGAINNGVELVREFGGDMQADVLDLIDASARLAARRLEFFRLAFGVGGSAGNRIGAGQARDVAAGIFADSKVAFAWPEAAKPGLDWEKEPVRLLLNYVLLAFESLPRGGTVRVETLSGEGRLSARVVAEGARAELKADIRKVLAEDIEPEALEAHNVHAYFACRLGVRLGADLLISDESTDAITFRILIP
ncbi:MAG: histidine phosphotransferase family protein [Alphaproteobacteria bacterium]